MYRKHFFGFEGQKYWVLMLFLEAPAAKMSQKGASERAPERGFWRGIFGPKSEGFVKKVHFSFEKGKIRVPKE